MTRKNVFTYFFVTSLALVNLSCGGDVQNKGITNEKDTVANKKLNALDLFEIDNMQFIRQSNTATLKGIENKCNRVPIPLHFIEYDTLQWSSKINLLNNFAHFFKTKDSLTSQLQNLDFIKSFLLENGYSETNFQFYQLKIIKTGKVNLKEYGEANFTILKKKVYSNGEQSKIMMLYNLKRKELSLWDCDNFLFTDGFFCIDFQVKNNHGLYQVAYCDKENLFFINASR